MPDPTHDRTLRFARVRRFTAAVLGLAAITTTAHSLQPTSEPRVNKVQFTLLVDGPATPGGTFTLGLHYRIAKDWHTYWDGLNDTGMPASWRLTLPEGWKAGEARWPAPTRYGMESGVVDHVYFNEATILIPISVPADAQFDSFDIAANSKWLVCQEACIPERAEAMTGVEVIDRPAKREPPPAIAAAKSRTIQSGWGDLASLRPESNVVDGALTVRVPGASKLAFFPASDSSPAENLIEEGEVAGDTLKVRMHQRQGEPLTVKGVIEVTRNATPGQVATSWHMLDFTPVSRDIPETPGKAPAK